MSSMKQYRKSATETATETVKAVEGAKDTSAWKSISAGAAAVRDDANQLITANANVSYTINQRNYQVLANLIQALAPKFEKGEKFNVTLNLRPFFNRDEVPDNVKEHLSHRGYISRKSLENAGIELDSIVP